MGRYCNYGEPLQTVFVTTTILSFTPVFKRAQMADTLVVGLLEDVRHYGARLHAFVVMPEHLHLLVQLLPDLGCRQFVQRIKSASAVRSLAHLTERERESMSRDVDAKCRGFWKAGFRSYVVSNRDEFNQKIDYIDNNPVKRNIVQQPGHYRWCTARFYGEQLDSCAEQSSWYTDRDGWDCTRLLKFFPEAEETDLLVLRNA